MEQFDGSENYGEAPSPLLSWRLSPAANGELVLGLRFRSYDDGKRGTATGVQISLPAIAALQLAGEMNRHARRALD